jgi:glycosyltransferase involved in cell wall biosynthesis
MRIVHVTPFYAPVIGGVEEVVRRVAEYMASRGYEVFVVTYNRLRYGGMGSLPKYEVINGVHVIRVKPNLMFSHGSYSSELAEVIRVLKPDIVHVHVWRHPHVFQIARLKKVLGFKAILHGHAPFHKLGQLGITIWAYHRVVDAIGRGYLDLYDRFVALTPYEAERVRYLGLANDKVVIIPNGVDEDKCVVDNVMRDEDRVLYLGRISRSKNLDLLAKSMVYVREEVRDVELVLAGPDEGLAAGIIEYSRRKGVKVKYLGPVTEDMKHKLYLRSSVYALPSLYEPFGITLLEAAQHGLPPVITGDGGQYYVIAPNIAGLWANSNPEDYARAITMLLTDRNLWRRLNRQAVERAARFTWNKILPKYEELYRELEV